MPSEAIVGRKLLFTFGKAIPEEPHTLAPVEFSRCVKMALDPSEASSHVATNPPSPSGAIRPNAGATVPPLTGTP